jgi:hypothetical protein
VRFRAPLRLAIKTSFTTKEKSTKVQQDLKTVKRLLGGKIYTSVQQCNNEDNNLEVR